MSALQLRGRKLAGALYNQTKNDLQQTVGPGESPPCIAVVQIGHDQNATGYARALQKASGRAGFGFRSVNLPRSTSLDGACSNLNDLNSDPAVAGILLLTPVPDHLQSENLHWRIDPGKDIDGTHPVNLGRLLSDAREVLIPATAAAGMALLDQTELNLAGKVAVVIGRSNTVGKPLALLLLQRHCTVTLAHSRTKELAQVASKADILCVAVGRPRMVTGDFVKRGATVMDFGTTYSEKGVLGDCEPVSVITNAAAFTPVPGGIGPLTNAMLMCNALKAYKKQRAKGQL